MYVENRVLTDPEKFWNSSLDFQALKSREIGQGTENLSKKSCIFV